MENYEYNKTFQSVDELPIDSIPNTDKDIKDFLLTYETYLKSTPHFIIPSAPQLFQQAIANCEQIAKEFSGRLKAKIDYNHFKATIELWCCYVEFEQGEFMSILQSLSHQAKSICFTPLTSGDLHIEIEMPYFMSAQILEESN